MAVIENWTDSAFSKPHFRPKQMVSHSIIVPIPCLFGKARNCCNHQETADDHGWEFGHRSQGAERELPLKKLL